MSELTLAEKTVCETEESYKSGSVRFMDSREVAQIVEKEHKHLLRDIKKYSDELTKSNIGLSDFFIESSYSVDGQSRKYPCYLVTKKGCEFIANKLTGIKGTKFTATYINRFHEMEDTIKNKEQTQIAELTNQVAELKTLLQGMCNSGFVVEHIESRLPKVEMKTRKLPKRKVVSEDWYERNRAIIYRACVEYGVKYSDIYHDILKRCGEKYDLEAANEIYRHEVGYYPKYAMDIVSYFPELAEIADKFLDSIK